MEAARGIFIVTGNKSKLREFRLLLGGVGIRVINRKVDLIEPKTLDQKEVAISTAKQAHQIIKQPLIVDDTGIYFCKYNNFPGTYSKFLFQTVGLEGLKQLIREGNKKAYFQTTLCFIDGKVIKIFQGRLYGKISLKKSSKFNEEWGYDSIFIPQGSRKFLSEYSLEERVKISHRAKAVKKLVNFLFKRYKWEV